MIRRLFDKDRKINNIVKQIQNHFDFLFNYHGFEIIDKVYDNQNFGNWIVLLRSDKLFIRFIQDRRDISLILGPHLGFHQLTDSIYLFDIDILVDYIKTRDFDILTQRPQKDLDKQLQRLSSLLLNNYDEIFSFVNNVKFDEEKDKINKLRREKFNNAFPNIRFANDRQSHTGGTL